MYEFHILCDTFNGPFQASHVFIQKAFFRNFMHSGLFLWVSPLLSSLHMTEYFWLFVVVFRSFLSPWPTSLHLGNQSYNPSTHLTLLQSQNLFLRQTLLFYLYLLSKFPELMFFFINRTNAF